MHRPRSLLSLALAACACALAAAPAAHATSPLAVALNNARPGDTVRLPTGTYGADTVASPRGRREAPVTLRPAPGAHPIVSGGFKLIGARHVRVIGITFDGTGNPRGFGTSIWSSHDVVFAGNEITGYRSAQGILVKGGSTGVRLIANHIHDLGLRARFEHGIYCESARGTVIDGNVIHDIASGYGIHLFGDCDGSRIVRNTIAHNGLSGIIIAGNDERGTSDRTLVAHNVIADHEHAAWSEYGFAVTEYNAGRRNVVRGNLFFGNAARKNVDCDRCAVRDNVVRDPEFVDPAHGNYALSEASPARAVIARGRR
ncbi:MAG TPA: right-handed parallel beta-helix repeat-containing protein [Solirubrobacteraceae bacterium]|nr:right-handed parallel beta-helix repeat-containing protein [Solirubrobacteraceae bacterium]